MDLMQIATEIIEFLTTVDKIQNCRIYGSLASGAFDEYSDIDIEIDVSGIDNGRFITKVPDLFKSKYNVIYSDYAPSLAPEKYVVSIAISEENPFCIVDIACIANPHIASLQRHDMMNLNHFYDHILKLFVIDLKHFIRKQNNYDDIFKMYQRIFTNNKSVFE